MSAELALPIAPPPLHPNEWERPDGNLEYRITQTFAHVNKAVSTAPHGALDIGNGRLGGKVLAADAGTVVAVGNLGYPWSVPTRLFASGNWGGLMVAIDHGRGRFTAYAHCASASVRVGQRVARGQAIATIGQSGSAIGQGHLHFEVWEGGPAGVGRRIDPEPLLRERGTMARRMPDGWHPIYNRHCRIAAKSDRKVRVRWEPGDAEPLPDGTVAHTFDRPEWFTVRGYVDTALGRWYGGELWIDGGWQWCYVFASLCGPLLAIDAPPDCSDKVREALAAAAQRVLAG